MKNLLFLKTFIRVRWREKWTSRDKLENYQQRQLAKHRDYMSVKSPYFKKHGFSPDFQMDKTFMMEHFNELNTVGIEREKALKLALSSEETRDFSADYQGISVGLSSGTSGNQGMFLTSEEEQTIWAATILAKLLPKGRLTGHRIAFFLRSNNNLYQSVNSALIHLHYFDMQEEVDRHIERLNNYQPSLLVAPASVLLSLAKAQKSGQLNIAPSKIFSVAEILEDTDRKVISQAFGGQIIHQVYQATEGFLGCTCEQGVLHLNEDGILFEKEWLDDQRFYPIITDFKRLSQPFIRYRLNDILQLRQTPCPCGSALLAIDKVEGRSDDIFYLKKQDGHVMTVYPDFIRRCFLAVSGIEEYQASQIGLSQIAIGLSNDHDQLRQDLEASFAKLVSTLDLQPIELSFVPYQIEPHKKLRRIKQNLNQEEVRRYHEKITH